MSLCSCCFRKFICTQNRSELKVFEVEPLMHNFISPKTPETVANLLYQYIWHDEEGTGTHILYEQESDKFCCLLCHTQKHRTYLQFEIESKNHYIIPFVCLPCSKQIQPRILETIRAVETDLREVQFGLLTRKLPQNNSLVHHIMAFLPRSHVKMKAVTFHRPDNISKFKDDDLSVWVEETKII